MSASQSSSQDQLQSKERQKQKLERYMPSIFAECDNLKQEYDKCFLEFFQDFVKPDYRHERNINPCQELHSAYRECLDKNLQLYKPYDIDLDELRKEVSINIQNNIGQGADPKKSK